MPPCFGGPLLGVDGVVVAVFDGVECGSCSEADDEGEPSEPLRSWSGWTAPAVTHLSTLNDDIDLHDILTEHTARVDKFHQRFSDLILDMYEPAFTAASPPLERITPPIPGWVCCYTTM